MKFTDTYYSNHRNPEERERTVLEKAWDIEDIGKRIRYLKAESDRLTQQLNVRIITRVEIDDYNTQMEMALDEIAKVQIRELDRIIEEFTDIKREQDQQTKINESTIYAGKGIQTKFTPKTFKADCELEKLEPIRKWLLKSKFINEISKDDFIYLFTEQLITEEMKPIIWIETGPLSHEFLRRLVYRKKQFNFKLVNACIKYSKGKKLDSNSKSTAQYKNAKLDQILDPIPEV